MNILESIVGAKRKRLNALKKRIPLKRMAAKAAKCAMAASLADSIRIPGSVSIIAEMKRKSPSAGSIMKKYAPAEIAKTFEQCGARGISILTEEDYFRGSAKHLEEAKRATALPILRKDFIVDPYQIYESRVLGASAVLLIVAALSQRDYRELLRLCKEIGMDALVEVHDEKELETALSERPGMVGINNRNLKTLSVNVDTTFRLAERVPRDVCLVSESGIAKPQIIAKFRDTGIQGALIGESILKSRNMRAKLQSFVEAGNG